MKSQFTILLFFCTLGAFAQKSSPEDTTEVKHKYRVSLPYFVPEGLIVDSWDDRTSIH